MDADIIAVLNEGNILSLVNELIVHRDFAAVSRLRLRQNRSEH